MKKLEEYYIGLDIGSDSVGFAVTDEKYNLIKFKGEPIWGSHLFDAASQCAERRSFRTARRRLDRRQQRVKLVDEILAPYVIKVDEDFYVRKKESALWSEDKSVKGNPFLFFNDADFDERMYYVKYPTIHHLICDLMSNSEEKFDIRLLNIAIDWLVAHRGHFLIDVDSSNADKVLEFDSIYNNFIEYFDMNEIDRPWNDVNIEAFGNILKQKGVNKKKTDFSDLLYGGKIPTKDDYYINLKELVSLLSGGKVKYSKLFNKNDVEEDVSFSISDDMEVVLPQLGDEADIVAKIAAMYDWSVLSDILGKNKYISESKVAIYNKHKEELAKLKAFVKKYAPNKYYEIFRKSDEKLKNYTAYSYNVSSVKEKSIPKGKASREDFYSYLKKTLNLDKLEVEDEDKDFLEQMKEEIKEGAFLPKQVNSDNRVIPYQLYFVELKKILKNASKHYSFLNEKDKDGYSPIEKIESIFEFKIPYYVGPLRTDNTKFGWMKRKGESIGKIYPWNFNDMVDLDESEESFIRRMTNICSYLPGEDVLPKWSLLYVKYNVLNEINNIKVNDVLISVEAKQRIYNELFCKNKKVTVKGIKEFLVCNGYMQKDDVLSGLDETVKSSLKSFHDFKKLLTNNYLSKEDVERIISRSTYAEDKSRYKRWIRSEFPDLSESDIKYLSNLKYKDFGRLSKEFLNGIEGANKETGEIGTIMHFLWETNDNLMELLSKRYTFLDVIEEKRNEYYSENPKNLNDQMDEMGISNAVKRPVIRTLAVVKDITSTLRKAPKKIFVEMARGPEEKKKRTVSRKEQILDLYKKCKEDTSLLEKELEAMGDMANNKLQSEKLFLYFMQLGKCMYSGEPIDLGQLNTTLYNIDHIHPQSYTKDDSILNNKVLVLSKINGDKSDVYPIDAKIRNKMIPFWTMLEKNGLITSEKYKRLIRHTPFTDSEKLGFISRQLVETRQSMKAVTQLLNTIYPDTEIVYVKANLAANFKQIFDLPPKSRIINDLHHAKDAYLNVVVGNVYNERFTKNFNVKEKYTLNMKYLFSRDVKDGKVWKAEEDINKVKKTYNKNNIHLTRYAFCQKGGLFDQMPVKKGNGQVPLKKGMDINKYGGYNKVTASFFVIVRYDKGKNKEVSFVPVDLMVGERFMNDDSFALDYVQKFLQGLNSKKIDNVEFPIGKRQIKIKTTLSLDGYKVWVNGKANKGAILLVSNAESAIYSSECIEYIKKLENYAEKNSSNNKILHDEEHDKLSEKMNISLFYEIVEKLGCKYIQKLPGNPYETVLNNKEKFEILDFNDQVKILLVLINVLKSGRSSAVDMSLIGGKKSAASVYISSSISGSKYNDIRIVDVSPAGLHVKESCNLKELL